MKNIILIHGIGGLGKETYFEHLKKSCEAMGLNVFVPELGGYKDGITYETWQKIFDDKYIHLLNKDTIILAQSMGTSFIVKYLAKNKLEVAHYISCAGPYNPTEFRNNVKESAIKFSSSAKTFMPSFCEYQVFKNLPFKKYSFYSNNDRFYEQSNLEKYSKEINSLPILVPNKSHFSGEGGTTQLKEVETFISKLL